MENKNLTDLEAVEAPVRAETLKQLPPKEKKKVIANLVECAMRMGIMDAYDIRRWLGLHRYSIQAITNARDEAKKRWMEDVENIAESAATERVIQIRKSWEEIRNCEQLYKEAKSVGDKIKVKQLQLQYMQYVAKLNFVDSIVEAGGTDTQINILAGSINHESD